jgi:membrane-associated phospholipid phosphatase
MAALLAVWLFAQHASRRAAWLWLAAVLADGGLIITSKVLYMGWGLHPPGWDFIGLSGHSAMAFLFWPVVGALAAEQSNLPRWPGIAAGAALAVGVAASRLALQVHSPSEVLLGSLWGALVAAAYLWRTRGLLTAPARYRHGWLLLLALVPPLLLARQLSFPSNWILAYTARQLTGHSVVFTRSDLEHRNVDVR